MSQVTKNTSAPLTVAIKPGVPVLRSSEGAPMSVKN
jgi:hypothetical protein